MSIAYALVCGRIEAYEEGTVKVVPNPYNPSINNVEYKSPSGMDCIVPGEEYFIRGTLEELQAIVEKEHNAIQCAVDSVLNDKFLNPSDTEKTLVRFLVEDGVDTEDITPERVNAIWRGMQPYFEWCGSFEDAYMDYMH